MNEDSYKEIETDQQNIQFNIHNQITKFHDENNLYLQMPLLNNDECIQCLETKELIINISLYDQELQLFINNQKHDCYSSKGFYISLDYDKYNLFIYRKCKLHCPQQIKRCTFCEIVLNKKSYKKCKKCKVFYTDASFLFNKCPECNYCRCNKCGRQMRLFSQFKCTCQYDQGFTSSFRLILLILSYIIIFPLMVYGQSLLIGMYYAFIFIVKLIDFKIFIGNTLFLIFLIPIIIGYIIAYIIVYFVYIIPLSIKECGEQIIRLFQQIYRNWFIE